MKFTFYTTLLCTLLFNSLNGQTPDNSFGKNGKFISNFISEQMSVQTAILQPDNKILIGGYDADETFYFPAIDIWRLKPNGKYDSSFGTNGRVRINGSQFGGSEYGGYLILQPDNKILVLGTDFDRDGLENDHVFLYRLNANGSFDSSFGTNGKTFANFGGYYAIGEAFILKPDGKIVVTGLLGRNYDNTRRIELVQFLPNGKIDPGFGSNGIVINKVQFEKEGIALKLLPDNKILAGFQFKVGNVNKTCLVKYNTNGTLNVGFGNGGIVLNAENQSYYGSKMALAIQADGKIVEYTTSATNNVLYRYNADGSKDAGFGSNGRVELPFTNSSATMSVVIDPNQKILINTQGFSVGRYLPNGSIDSSFGTNGILTTDFKDTVPVYVANTEAILIQPDSKIVAIGNLLDVYNGVSELVASRFKNVAPLSVQQVDEATAIVANDKLVTVYPNPATSVLNIKGLKANNQYDISIVDAKGNVVAAKQIDHTSLYNWNIQNLAGGLYYLNISSGNQGMTIKFIKQ